MNDYHNDIHQQKIKKNQNSANKPLSMESTNYRMDRQLEFQSRQNLLRKYYLCDYTKKTSNMMQSHAQQNKI